MVAGYQRMFENYSRSYNEIMANLKVANEYNIKFKSDMEYSMYRVMIGLIDVDKFENGDILEGKSKYATVVKNPLNMIASARHAFGKSIERVPGSDGDIKIKGILSCLDSLEKALNFNPPVLMECSICSTSPGLPEPFKLASSAM